MIEGVLSESLLKGTLTDDFDLVYWHEHWQANYISDLEVETTDTDEQTITATIVGTNYDGCSFEYSTDFGLTWTVAGTSVDGNYVQDGLSNNIRYDWRARLYKGIYYSNYSPIGYDIIGTFNYYWNDELGDYSFRNAAQHYNGITYITYQGDDDDPYIITYNPETDEFSIPVKVGINPLANGDDHGQPAILVDNGGYIHIFYGSHTSQQKYARSTNSEDISSWDDMGNITPYATYPQPIQLSSGTIYMFYRKRLLGVIDWRYVKSTDGGDSWDGETVVISAGYSYFWFKKGVGDTIHVSGMDSGTTETSADRHNIYYMKYEDGDWQTIDGIIKTLPIAHVDNDLLIYDSGSEWTPVVALFNDENNDPVILFSEGHTGDPVGGGAGDFYYRIIIYNRYSEQWNDYDIGDAQGDHWRDFSRVLIIDSICCFDAYLIEGGDIADEYGGNIVKYSSIDRGATWTKSQMMLKGMFLDPDVVRNYHNNAKVIMAEYADDDTTWTRKAYLWGDEGFKY